MSGSAVIWIVRATKRNDVNDKRVFTGFGGFAGNNITSALAKLGVGRSLANDPQLHMAQDLLRRELLSLELQHWQDMKTKGTTAGMLP